MEPEPSELNSKIFIVSLGLWLMPVCLGSGYSWRWGMETKFVSGFRSAWAFGCRICVEPTTDCKIQNKRWTEIQSPPKLVDDPVTPLLFRRRHEVLGYTKSSISEK